MVKDGVKLGFVVTQKSVLEKVSPIQKLREAGIIDPVALVKLSQLMEKWGKDVEIKSTGEYKDWTVEELRAEMEKMKGSENFDKEKYGELQFALRAKTGWKKGEGATGMKKESEDMGNKMVTFIPEITQVPAVQKIDTMGETPELTPDISMENDIASEIDDVDSDTMEISRCETCRKYDAEKDVCLDPNFTPEWWDELGYGIDQPCPFASTSFSECVRIITTEQVENFGDFEDDGSGESDDYSDDSGDYSDDSGDYTDDTEEGTDDYSDDTSDESDFTASDDDMIAVVDNMLSDLQDDDSTVNFDYSIEPFVYEDDSSQGYEIDISGDVEMSMSGYFDEDGFFVVDEMDPEMDIVGSSLSVEDLSSFLSDYVAYDEGSDENDDTGDYSDEDTSDDVGDDSGVDNYGDDLDTDYSGSDDYSDDEEDYG